MIMFSRRHVYLFAVILSISLIYIFKSTIPFPDSFKLAPFTGAGTSNYFDIMSSPSQPGPIAMTLVFMGQAAAREGLITIKSALMHSSRPLDIHLICSEDAVEIIESKIQLIKRPYYALKITFHIVPIKRVQERLERANIGAESRNWPMLSKLLIHEILVGVEKAIFVDSDMIFVVDPLQLWDSFDTLNEKTLLALPTLGPTSHAGQICTCVMLLHLERMRTPEPDALLIPSSQNSGYKAILTSAFDAAEKNGMPSLLGRPERVSYSRKNPPFGDQGAIYALWMHRPDLFVPLSLRWDITQCRSSYGLSLWGFVDKNGKLTNDDTTISEEEHIQKQGRIDTVGDGLIVPGIIHFNCQPDAGSNVWDWPENHDDTLKTWAPMVTSSVRYKWAWLNRGNGSATVSISKITDFRWLDEPTIDANDNPDI